MTTIPGSIPVPEGCKMNAKGNYVPLANIRAEDLLRDELIDGLMPHAKDLQDQLKAFKSQCFEKVADYRELIFAAHGVEKGGMKGNIELTSFDGCRRLKVQAQDTVTFSELLQVAKAKIDRCLKRWSQGADENLRAVVDQAFDTDKSGSLIVGRILGLRRLEISDQEWREAMDLISDSIQVIGTSKYVRFYERDTPDGAWRSVPLDLAKL